MLTNFIIILITTISKSDRELILMNLEKIEKIIENREEEIKRESLRILIKEIKKLLIIEEKNLTDKELREFKEKMANIPIVDKALEELRKLVEGKKVTTSQAKELIELFHFKEDREKVYEILEKKIIDRENLKELRKLIK
ncbi:MAG: DUF4476 domain-containing protein [Candidatus Hydrothermales bacterium]